MAYPLEAGDIIEVSFDQVLFGQRVLNIRHYVCDNLPVDNSAHDMFDALLTALAAPTKVIESFLACASSQLSLEHVVFQRIKPSRYARYTRTVGTAGDYDEDCFTANTAYEVALRTDKATVRTGGVKKGQVGRWQGAGVPRTEISEGILSPAYQVKMNALGAALKEVLVDANAVEWTPVLFHRGKTLPADLTDVITDYVSNTKVRTQRTRTVGKGE